MSQQELLKWVIAELDRLQIPYMLTGSLVRSKHTQGQRIRLWAMAIQHISAVTFSVQDMARSVAFYQRIGLPLNYGGRDSGFTSFRAGSSYINLMLTGANQAGQWGRVILRVDSADEVHRDLKRQGLSPETPRDGAWGERYFHLQDPDGHELSFAELLR